MAKHAKYDIESLHEIEAKNWEYEPELGAKDISECLVSWIPSFCKLFETKEPSEFSHAKIRAVLHTLLAARVRQARLIQERDEARAKAEEWKSLYIKSLVYCDEITKLTPSSQPCD